MWREIQALAHFRFDTREIENFARKLGLRVGKHRDEQKGRPYLHHLEPLTIGSHGDQIRSREPGLSFHSR